MSHARLLDPARLVPSARVIALGDPDPEQKRLPFAGAIAKPKPAKPPTKVAAKARKPPLARKLPKPKKKRTGPKSA